MRSLKEIIAANINRWDSSLKCTVVGLVKKEDKIKESVCGNRDNFPRPKWFS